MKTGNVEHLPYFVFGRLGSTQSPEALAIRANVSDEPRDDSVILYHYSLWSHYWALCVVIAPNSKRASTFLRFWVGFFVCLFFNLTAINVHCFPFSSKRPVKTVLYGFYSLFIFALDSSSVLYHRVCRCKNKADIVSQSNPLICGIHSYNYSQI